MTRKEFQERLNQQGVDHLQNRFAEVLKSCIRLQVLAVEENELALGQSKIGGRPDLPARQKWPVDDEENPMSFVAQINFEQVSPFDQDGLLPATGIAWFFYHGEQDVWGFDPEDKTGFKVLYYDDNLSSLKRMDYPDDLAEYADFKAGRLELRQEITLPSIQGGDLSFLSKEQLDIYIEHMLEYGTINKLLGHPDPIQGDMQLECELVTNGIFCGNPSGYNDPRAKMLEKNADNWQLLLQVDSNDELGMSWGDAGRLYFWIKKEDLKNKAFKKCWVILQCS